MGTVFHFCCHNLCMPKRVTIQSPLEPSVSLVGHMFNNIAFARNVTLALGSCPVKKSVLLPFLQVVLPLSYAAQIPTTPKADLANVRLSVSNVNRGQVQYQRVVRALLRVYFCARMCVEVCVR